MQTRHLTILLSSVYFFYASTCCADNMAANSSEDKCSAALPVYNYENSIGDYEDIKGKGITLQLSKRLFRHRDGNHYPQFSRSGKKIVREFKNLHLIKVSHKNSDKSKSENVLNEKIIEILGILEDKEKNNEDTNINYFGIAALIMISGEDYWMGLAKLYDESKKKYVPTLAIFYEFKTSAPNICRESLFILVKMDEVKAQSQDKGKNIVRILQGGVIHGVFPK